MDRSPLLENPANGGFPEPPAGARVRWVAARHAECGEATRVRLPEAVPARAVRRLRCARCERAFEADAVEELGLEAPVTAAPEEAPEPDAEPDAADGHEAGARPPAGRPPGRRRLALPSLPKLPPLPKLDPQSRTWRLASAPIAAALVITGLVVVTGGDDAVSGPVEPGQTAASAPPAKPPHDGRGGAGAERGGASKSTKLVRGSSYSLALPAGWERVDPAGGATFAAVAPDGDADVTLWIENDPALDFPSFVNQSLAQLESLTGSASVVERAPAPTPEETVVVLAADAPRGEPTYEVTLRVAGPYRYYLATTAQPDASSEAVSGAELITGSFTPEGGG